MHARERALARLAERQHGVASARQLGALGFSRHTIGRRVAAGRLHRIHRGVYAVGHRRLTRHGHWMAAVLASGPAALLSHASAAALWGIRPTAASRVDVTAPRSRHPQPRIALHRTRSLHPDDRSEHDGIPVTSLARTLLDLAAVASERGLGRAFEEADRLQLLDLRAVEGVCERGHGRRGRGRLLALIARASPAPQTRRELERRFLDLVRESGLPDPLCNATVEGLEVDALWPAQRLVVELDSYDYHRHRAAFERDRARGLLLEAAGYRVLRVTWRQLTREPEVVEAAIRSRLEGS